MVDTHFSDIHILISVGRCIGCQIRLRRLFSGSRFKSWVSVDLITELMASCFDSKKHCTIRRFTYLLNRTGFFFWASQWQHCPVHMLIYVSYASWCCSRGVFLVKSFFLNTILMHAVINMPLSLFLPFPVMVFYLYNWHFHFLSFASHYLFLNTILLLSEILPVTFYIIYIYTYMFIYMYI